jgi:opacity protein-like surface antigen
MRASKAPFFIRRESLERMRRQSGTIENVPTVLLLLLATDPQPCERVAEGVWRCPGASSCREGMCVPPATTEPKPPPPDKSPSDPQWFKHHGRYTVEVGPFLGRDTAGALESGDAGVSFGTGIAAQLKHWLAIEAPFDFMGREFSSRTFNATQWVKYDDRASLEQFSFAALARFDVLLGRVRLSAGAGPELMVSNVSFSATQNLPIAPPSNFTNLRFDGDDTSVRPGLQWIAAFEAPADAGVSVGLAYRGHYANANFSPLVQGNVDVGGNAFVFRVSLRP